MANWEEVRLLAASFQQIQSSSSTFHKLSERNCIELITKLSDMKLLEVMYTLDGREYVTPECLEAEIRREVNAHKGANHSTHAFTLLYETFFLPRLYQKFTWVLP